MKEMLSIIGPAVEPIATDYIKRSSNSYTKKFNDNF